MGQVWRDSHVTGLSTRDRFPRIDDDFPPHPWIPNRRPADTTAENRMRSSARYSNKANKRGREGRKEEEEKKDEMLKTDDDGVLGSRVALFLVYSNATRDATGVCVSVCVSKREREREHLLTGRA